MRNSGIVLSIVALAVLIFSVIASYYAKSSQIISIGTLVCLGLIGVSTLLTCLSTPSEAKKLDEAHEFDNDMRTVWDRFQALNREIDDTSSNINRYFDNEISAIHTRLEDLENKRK